MYVIHVFRQAELLGGNGPPPVICRGPAEELPAAWSGGCTDYLKEPWTAGELHFRTGKILSTLDAGKTWNGLSIDTGGLAFSGVSVPLSVQEYRILSLLIRQEGTAVPREALYYGIWGKLGGNSRAVDVHISKLRAKIAGLQSGIPREHRAEIVSIHGEGYAIFRSARSRTS